MWLSLFGASPAPACTENTILDLIGGLEAPGGYDTVWHGVRHPPPRPVSQMTIGEVIDWQREAMRTGSASTAAGQYQLIRPTLEALVRNGVISRDELFDAAAQDRLAQHLLRETGYRGGAWTDHMAETMARIWPSLPRIGGQDAGRAIYEGMVGNHALIDANTFRDVLNCTIGVDIAFQRAQLIRAGERFGFHWDQFLTDMVSVARTVMTRSAQLGIGLILTLFLVDLVWRGGQWLLGAQGPARYMESLIYRLVIVVLCIALLMYPTAVVDLISTTARTMAGGSAGGGGTKLAEFAASRMALMSSLLEGVTLQQAWVQAFLYLTGIMIALLTAFQMAMVVFWNFRLLMEGIGGLFAVGFGGLSQTAHIPRKWLRSLLSTGLALLAALLVIETLTGLAWDVRTSLTPLQAAGPILLLEMLTAILIWTLPDVVHQSIRT